MLEGMQIITSDAIYTVKGIFFLQNQKIGEKNNVFVSVSSAKTWSKKYCKEDKLIDCY